MKLLWISALVGTISIGTAIYLFFSLRKHEVRSPGMKEVAGYIAVGVRAYLSRQLQTVILITPFIAVALYSLNGTWVAITFVLGVLTSLLTAFLGMNAAVRANGKTAEEAVQSPVRAFHTAVLGGSIMGFSITGFSLVVLSVLYAFLKDASVLVGFGFGASLAALFAQIGGGIYTKSRRTSAPTWSARWRRTYLRTIRAIRP